MARYWVYIDSKIQGPVDVPSLRKITGFTLLTQVCPENEQTWRVADEIIEIKSYFLSPPRTSTMLAQAANGDIVRDSGPIVSVIEPGSVVETPPETKGPDRQAGLTPSPMIIPLAKEPAGPAGLRQLCDKCGYKNPRDVNSCMKCGSVLKEGDPAPAPAAQITKPVIGSVPSLVGGLVLEPGKIRVQTPSVSPAPSSSENPMIEIPVTRLLMIAGAASAIGILGFVGAHLWKTHRHPSRAASIQTPVTSSKHEFVPPVHTYKRPGKGLHRLRSVSSATALPGMARKGGSSRSLHSATPAATPPENESGAPYRVLEEAAPVRHRNPAPANSPYATKRRGDKKVWLAQEEQAIQQVQHERIYGGLRTLQRNTDILMQILRDREYNTAFESGKRIYLYNDVDWDVSQKDGPLYEVRLTFSGGKEVDGTARQPLKFAFDADLERGTVIPGGDDRVRSNTMHAFFDESRIPPEDRRAIAKDTEELVLAAQPDASPLALDTVVRHFIATYTKPALERVAIAFQLNEVQRKLQHEPNVVSETAPEEAPVPKTPSLWGEAAGRPGDGLDKTPHAATPPASQGEGTPAKVSQTLLPKTGGIEYQMTNGTGRERLITVRGRTSASPAKFWETLTAYDRLKQFCPDLLVSEREGQDGAAVIVHAVALTRLYFFVFKINLHLRVIEHPQQHSLEFERIAGEFEQFRGAVEISSDPAGGPSIISFHATVVPKGVVPGWALRDMGKRLLIPLLEAVRIRAESL